jgi:hypothetical protein
MASLVEIKGNYYLQFFDGNKSPSRKKVPLGTQRKRVAKKLKRKYEDAYALGEYDPWTGEAEQARPVLGREGSLETVPEGETPARPR